MASRRQTQGLAMTMKTFTALNLSVAIALIGMVTVAGSFGTGNAERRIEGGFDIAAVLASADVANLPIQHIDDLN
jgi:hypothetical protein